MKTGKTRTLKITGETRIFFTSFQLHPKLNFMILIQTLKVMLSKLIASDKHFNLIVTLKHSVRQKEIEDKHLRRREKY